METAWNFKMQLFKPYMEYDFTKKALYTCSGLHVHGLLDIQPLVVQPG